MGQRWIRGRLGATCAMAVLLGTGLSGCDNLGKKAGEALLQPSQSPTHHRPIGPTREAAKSFLRKTFTLYDRGQPQRACAFSESKPYLTVDRDCASHSAKVVALFHSRGLSLLPKAINVQLHGTEGRANFVWVIDGRRVGGLAYLQYDGHRWWMTGDKKTGDRGL